jgi:hypothetical protein
MATAQGHLPGKDSSPITIPNSLQKNPQKSANKSAKITVLYI